MTEAFAIGPFVVSLRLLLIVGSLAVGWWVGERLARGSDRSAAKILLRAFVVAIVAARVVHVVEWFDAYAADPLDIVDVRDAGFNLPVGLLVGWLYVLAASPRGGRSTRPAQLALVASMVAFVAGSALLEAGHGERRLDLDRLAVTTLDGSAVTLKSFEGRPTVVNLWATWCGPCRREMPLLAKAESAHPDLDFVFVNQGEETALVTRFLSDQGLTLRHVVLDGGSQVARAVDLRAWPTTVYLDATGRVLDVDVGGLTAAKLEQRLEALKTAAR